MPYSMKNTVHTCGRICIGEVHAKHKIKPVIKCTSPKRILDKS